MSRKRFEKRTAVIDTSCLIHLWKLNLLRSLVIFYEIVYIPLYVKEEAGRKGKIKRRLQELIAQNDFLQTCNIRNDYDVQLLYDRQRNPKARIQRGEAEVIIQARECSISEVLIHDKKGEKAAKLHTLSVKNTFDILNDFERIGIIENAETKLQEIGLLKK